MTASDEVWDNYLWGLSSVRTAKYLLTLRYRYWRYHHGLVSLTPTPLSRSRSRGCQHATTTRIRSNVCIWRWQRGLSVLPSTLHRSPSSPTPVTTLSQAISKPVPFTATKSKRTLARAVLYQKSWVFSGEAFGGSLREDSQYEQANLCWGS